MGNFKARPMTGLDIAGGASGWIAGAILILYGFAKLTGAQFTILDSEVTKPMGEVSGFWLTWYYFGYSQAYGTIIALVQILGGLLLMWPRTSLLGALLLFPVVVNIALTDIFFGVNALSVALLILVCLSVVILPHTARLREAILPPPSGKMRFAAIRIVAALALLGAAWGFTYWVANYNNRAPTPIDGVWRVEGQAAPVQRIFFEHNRAHLAVFRTLDGTDRTHHFEVDADGRVQIWERWLAKGSQLYEGQVNDSDTIRLRSTTDSTELLLTREQ